MFKQNITVEQWEKLSDDSRRKIRYWMVDHKYASEDMLSMQYDALLSIGQMIEFLDAYEPDKEVLNIYRNESYLKIENRIPWKRDDGVLVTQGTRRGWTIEHFFPNPWYKVDTKKEGDELCDTLWEACKEILEK